MRNHLLRRLGENRPQIVTLGIVALFAAMLGCGGGGGGGGGTSATSTTSTSTTSTSTTSTSTTSTSTTSTSTTAGSTTSETTGTTGSSLPANRIFFQDIGTDLKHMNPDGSDEQTLTAMPTGYKGFAQNPTNSNIKAFAFAPGTPDPENGVFAQYDIYVNSSVSTVGATKLTAIAKADIGSIMFTPDGSQIVFTAATGSMVQGDNGPVPEYSYQLFVIDATAPNQTPVPLDSADDAYVAPTGTRIVYTHWPLSASNPRVAAIDTDGTDKVILTYPGSPSGSIPAANFMPQYNKSGTQICFATTRSGQFEIWKMNSNGSSVTQVTNLNSTLSDRCFGSSFNSNGSEVAFTRITVNSGTSGVYRVPSAGGTEVLVRAGFLQPWIYWSPESSTMPGRGIGSASTPLGFGTSRRIKELLGIED